MTTLAGKVVFVTGASRGIGAVTTRSLLEAGASVVAHFGRTGQGAESLLDTFGLNRVHPVQGDLARAGEATRLFQEAVAWKGRVDVLVNNAGIAPSLTIDVPLDKWSDVWAETLQVNLLSVAESCRAALLHYGEHGGGIIINIASRAAFRGDNPDAMHYAASKGAVITLTKSIARGFAGQGVLAYSVAPGWVITEMAEAYLVEHAEQLRRELPMGQAAPPEDVANTVVFLASGAVPHMTGATLDINGASYVR
ncbi:SDR family NAD(P)-dependent oxidoreductase [Deinococcus alpinitundrae]|uniref:SDR family NAD(P)-dependent oxidoreductase n=1 Tax=Deinococcus alpinitundrae TaxID=468913 RepID=UPI00137AA862|nr:SDR family NAD(P)-dependent oxidoreductase [Deinococcus alpinitundrae]